MCSKIAQGISGILVATLASVTVACVDSLPVSPVKETVTSAMMAEEAAPQETYTAIDLGTLPGAIQSEATAINSSGDAAGWGIDGSNTYHPVLWSGSQIIDLGLPNGMPAQAFGMNDAGQVVGTAYGTGSDRVGFVWSAVSGFTILAGPGNPTASYTQAWDINNAGVVVGGFQDVGTPLHAYSWTAGGGFVDLHPAGYGSSHALAISENGIITGFAYDQAGIGHAVIWAPKQGFVDLGLPPHSSYSVLQGRSVNSYGTVVGDAHLAGSTISYPFRWRPKKGIKVYPQMTVATGINDGDRVVGYTYNLAFTVQTALTSGPRGGQQPLPKLPDVTAQWSRATAINACGVIVGSGQYSSVAYLSHAVKWVPPACTP